VKDFDDKPQQICRRSLLGACACFFFVNACGAKSMRSNFDVVLFNYLDRPIFEVLVDGVLDVSSTPYPATGGGTNVGVQLTHGPKTVTWRLGGPAGMARNGETITAKNQPELKAIKNGKYLGIHIYPDFTVELIPTVYYPDFSPRGLTEMHKMGRDRD